MILIADSGGSKIDWRLLHKNGDIFQANTPGFNPYYQSIDDLKKSIKESILPLVQGKIEKVFFYGAGVSSEKNQIIIRQAFHEFFPATHIEIGWDLLAAARALCGTDPGIACIMGTGSNSCLYNGKEIVDIVANLGWILADEGSGAYIGKRFVKDYLRKDIPQDLSDQFAAFLPLDREEILEHVYQLEKPSAFLAGFTKFIHQHLDHPYCYQLMYDSFSEFYEDVVMKYSGYQDFPVHFTGSIAYHFREILKKAAHDRNIRVKNILEGPIEGLILYHQKDLS